MGIIEMYVMNRMDMLNVLNRCSQVQIILQAQSKVRLVVHLDSIKISILLAPLTGFQS